MKIGDLIIHDGKNAGVITHIFDTDDDNHPDVCVLFEDGECQVSAEDCEVADESR
jgi:ATP sulfurylase